MHDLSCDVGHSLPLAGPLMFYGCLDVYILQQTKQKQPVPGAT